MKPSTVPLVVLLLTTAIFAGCIGGDDAIDSEDPGQDLGGLGAIVGRVYTLDLDPVVDARVELVKDNEPVAEGTTNEQGEYSISGVEPGEYRMQVNAVCCRQDVVMVTIIADETVDQDLQLQVYSSDDLQIPRVERYEWTGFLACTFRFYNPSGPHHDMNVFGVPGGVSGVNACGLVDVVTDDILGAGNTTDDDFLYTFDVYPGLKTVVGGMQWRAPGAALGDELSITLEVDGRPNIPPRYASGAGHAPVEFRADAGYVIENYDEEDDEGNSIHQYDFDNIEESLTLMYRIFAGGDANVVYQQRITVYYDLYYWEAAPETATAIPDL